MEELSSLLEIKNLKVNFFLPEGTVEAVRGVDLKIYHDKTLGIVGESGCGKSVMSQAILRIVPEPGKIIEGELIFARTNGESVDLVKLDQRGKDIRNIRGKEIAIIFQEPMTALSPLYTIGNQIAEAIIVHQDVGKKEARRLATEILSRVGIPKPDLRIDQYPFELSGGLRQRAVIAMALICHPNLLIADEPTTALDVTIQAQILRLFKDLQAEFKMSVIFITHDIAIVSEIADEVAVMYLGRIVEQGSTREIFGNPIHPYTAGLLQCVHKFGSAPGGPLIPIRGTLPGPFEKLDGCPFYPRCPKGDPSRCLNAIPRLQVCLNEHKVACFLADDKVA